MASTLLSPGVVIQEKDLTLGSIETVEVNVGAIAGAFSKGPVINPLESHQNQNYYLNSVNQMTATMRHGSLLQVFSHTEAY